MEPESPQPEPRPVVLVVADPIADGDVPRLCERLRVLLNDSDGEVIVCDVGALAANAVTVDALARLQLAAHRLGRRIRLQRVPRELDQLLSFCGLADVLAEVTTRAEPADRRKGTAAPYRGTC